MATIDISNIIAEYDIYEVYIRKESNVKLITCNTTSNTSIITTANTTTHTLMTDGLVHPRNTLCDASWPISRGSEVSLLQRESSSLARDDSWPISRGSEARLPQ